MEYVFVNSILSLWLPFVQLWAPFGSLLPLDVFWGPVGRLRASMGSPWGVVWNMFKIGYDFPNKKADITASAHKN